MAQCLEIACGPRSVAPLTGITIRCRGAIRSISRPCTRPRPTQVWSDWVNLLAVGCLQRPGEFRDMAEAVAIEVGAQSRVDAGAHERVAEQRRADAHGR